MIKSGHPMALSLRVLAAKLERNLLTESEIKGVAQLLRRLGNGETFDEILEINRPANRPIKGATEYYVEQVHGLMLLTHNGKPGVSISDVIQKVADACMVSSATVKNAYYSSKGRAHLTKVKRAFEDPLTWLMAE